VIIYGVFIFAGIFLLTILELELERKKRKKEKEEYEDFRQRYHQND